MLTRRRKPHNMTPEAMGGRNPLRGTVGMVQFPYTEDTKMPSAFPPGSIVEDGS